MLRKNLLTLLVVTAVVSITAPLSVNTAQAVLPLDCDEFISGGGQGHALGCIDWVIHMYESAGPWDGTWEPGGHGTWPPY